MQHSKQDKRLRRLNVVIVDYRWCYKVFHVVMLTSKSISVMRYLH